jgi:hypothetical protein
MIFGQDVAARWQRRLVRRWGPVAPATKKTIMTYAPHQQRVVDEKAELNEKLGKLHDFIQDNPIFKTLPEDEQKRLQRQDLVMAEYSQILGERIEAFTA